MFAFRSLKILPPHTNATHVHYKYTQLFTSPAEMLANKICGISGPFLLVGPWTGTPGIDAKHLKHKAAYKL